MTDLADTTLSQSTATRTAALAVGTTNGQLCAIATRAYQPGEEIVRLTGAVVSQPTRYSVQVGADEHIDPPPGAGLEEMIDEHTWRYMNHACDPNTAFRGRVLYAVRAIAAGEEVRFHYAATEYEMAEGFVCHCGAENCVGEVRGYRYLSAPQQRRLAEHAQPHVIAAASRAAR